MAINLKIFRRIKQCETYINDVAAQTTLVRTEVTPFSTPDGMRFLVLLEH